MRSILALAMGTLLAAPAFADSTYFGGPYGGIQISHSQLDTKHSDVYWWYSNVSNVGITKQSTVGGLRAGYDWVKGSVIFGILGEASFGNQSSIRETGEFITMYKIGSEVKKFGSLRAKAGVVSEKIALFATAGIAFADIQHKYVETYETAPPNTFNAKGDGTGYVIGAGAAYAINEKSSIGFDISRYQFGARTHEVLNVDSTPGGYFFKMKDNLTTVNVSYNHRF